MEDELDFKCEDGHYFKMNDLKFKNIVEGKKVLNGLKTQFKTNSGQVITLKTIQDFAKSINYKLITNNYTNVNDKMDWICNNGHKVHKSYRQFQRNKTGNYCDEFKLNGK